ncbi:MAG: HEPN domain-containing protein [Candidatus Wallbacteria bacterium]|nr:HEPN domain-containing protein [Candidatus Wallbacteria bacterium]
MTLNDSDKRQLIAFRTEQSSEALSAARLMLENGFLSAAVNRIYYSTFYLITALALKDGFTASKHRQLIGWFNRTYIRTGVLGREYGRLVKTAFEKRNKGDYSELFRFEATEVREMSDSASDFFEKIRKLLEAAP